MKNKTIIGVILIALMLTLSGCASFLVENSPDADFVTMREGILKTQTYAVDQYGNNVPVTRKQLRMINSLSLEKREAYILTILQNAK